MSQPAGGTTAKNAVLPNNNTSNPARSPTNPPHVVVEAPEDDVSTNLFHRHLFSLKNNRQSSRLGFGRSYDYEYKYPEDAFGQETSPEARLWKVNNDECDLYDTGKIEAWRDALDVLLVFLGLFSAIVSAFLVEGLKLLQPDYGELTATMMHSFLSSVSPNNASTAQQFELPNLDEPFAPSRAALWINALWYTSLTISLSTGLLTVLTKQWLYRYILPTSGSAQDRSRTRQFRYAGLEKYRVPAIIDFLPVALHVSLGLFLAGLALFTLSLHHAIAGIVVGITGVAYVFYVTTILLPLWDPQCPYQSHFTVYIYQLKIRVFDVLVGYMRRWSRGLHAGFTGQRSPSLEKTSHPSPARSLLELERCFIAQQADKLDIDTVTWLHDASSNTTVRDIIAQSAGALIALAADTTPLSGIVLPYVESLLEGCTINDEPLNTHSAEYAAIFGSFQAAIFQPARPTTDSNSMEIFRTLLVPKPGTTTSALYMPLDMWRLWFRFVFFGRRDLVQDPLILAAAIDAMNMPLTPPPQNRLPLAEQATNAVGFVMALTSNNYVRSIVEQSIHVGFDVPYKPMQGGGLRDVLRILSILKRITDNAESRALPAQGEMLLLECCVRHLDRRMHSTKPTESVKNQVRDALDAFIGLSAVLDETLVSWKALKFVFSALTHLEFEPKVQITPGRIHSILRLHSRKIAPTDSPDFPSFCGFAERYFTWWFGPARPGSSAVGTVWDQIRTMDVLPDACQPGEDFRTHMWSYGMCHAILATRFTSVPSSSLKQWKEYIDTPGRLLILAQAMLNGQLHDGKFPNYSHRPGIGDNDFEKRVEVLVKLLPSSENWRPCFKHLLQLLDSSEAMNRVMLWNNETHRTARQQFVIGLKHIQKLTTLDWSDPQYNIPQFDAEDRRCDICFTIPRGS